MKALMRQKRGDLGCKWPDNKAREALKGTLSSSFLCQATLFTTHTKIDKPLLPTVPTSAVSPPAAHHQAGSSLVGGR